MFYKLSVCCFFFDFTLLEWELAFWRVEEKVWG